MKKELLYVKILRKLWSLKLSTFKEHLIEAFIQLGHFSQISDALWSFYPFENPKYFCYNLIYPSFLGNNFETFYLLFSVFFLTFSLNEQTFLSFLSLHQINVISRHNKSFSKEMEKVFLRKTKLDYLNHQSSEPSVATLCG